MNRLALTSLLALAPVAMYAQEGPSPTQVLVTLDSKTPVTPVPDTFKLELNGHATPLTGLEHVPSNGTQIAILIDDGLRFTIGRDLDTMKTFVKSLPSGTEIFIGYMQNGRVLPVQPFTTDLASASEKFRLPLGVPGISASPYFSLSDFVKRWHGSEDAPAARQKARFALMITNGVDPYNGSTSILNQDSPYVQTAIDDAQRAGVAVSAIYWGDAGIRGGRANFSGQSYLSQLTAATGGYSFYQGTFNPVSVGPYLTEFQHDISDTYIATFQAEGKANGKPELLHLKLTTSTPKVKLRHPDAVRPGNVELPTQQ